MQERYLPRSSGLPRDNVQINGWGRISGIWGMRARERKERAESVSQGRWQAGEGRYPVLGRAGTLTVCGPA